MNFVKNSHGVEVLNLYSASPTLLVKDKPLRGACASLTTAGDALFLNQDLSPFLFHQVSFYQLKGQVRLSHLFELQHYLICHLPNAVMIVYSPFLNDVFKGCDLILRSV